MAAGAAGAVTVPPVTQTVSGGRRSGSCPGSDSESDSDSRSGESRAGRLRLLPRAGDHMIGAVENDSTTMIREPVFQVRVP
jgi:hypothetical protein